jgi:hypothetical protein
MSKVILRQGKNQRRIQL